MKPHRKSRDAQAKGKSNFQRKFEFIHASDSSSRKKGRVHVTREYNRERRWKQLHNLRLDSPTDRTPPSALFKTDFVVSVARLRADAPLDDDTPVFNDDGLPQFRVDPGDSEAWDDSNLNALAMQGFNPTSPLGAGRVDPFNCYPINATRDVHLLVDHYTVVIPSLLHQRWGRRIIRCMPSADLFRTYVKDAAAFRGMLHHSAHHVAKMHGVYEDTQQILEHKVQTIGEINARFHTSQAHSDGTIIAVGLLANAERLWGSKEISRMHWRGLKQMIGTRGGLQAFKDNPILQIKLTWSYIALAGSSMTEGRPYVDNYFDAVPLPSCDSRLDDGLALKQACDEFVELFRERKAATLRNLPTSHADAIKYEKFALRNSAFKRGTKLLSLLSPSPGEWARYYGVAAERSRSARCCRLACLLYLNATMMEYGDFSEETENFLEILTSYVNDKTYDWNLSAEHTLWPLLRGIETHDTLDRTWLVARLMGVAKRSGYKTWELINKAALMFLQMPEDGSQLLRCLSGWDALEFRKEILGTDMGTPSSVWSGSVSSGSTPKGASIKVSNFPAAV